MRQEVERDIRRHVELSAPVAVFDLEEEGFHRASLLAALGEDLLSAVHRKKDEAAPDRGRFRLGKPTSPDDFCENMKFQNDLPAVLNPFLFGVIGQFP